MIGLSMIHPLARKTIQIIPSLAINESPPSFSFINLADNENHYKGVYSRYPNTPATLRRRYAKLIEEDYKEISGCYSKNLDESCILFGNGSDSLIDLIIRVFCEPLQ